MGKEAYTDPDKPEQASFTMDLDEVTRSAAGSSTDMLGVESGRAEACAAQQRDGVRPSFVLSPKLHHCKLYLALSLLPLCA
jgi:hypothetical protein